MDKSTESVTIHLPLDAKRQFLIFAETAGLTPSELGRTLIDSYLERQLLIYHNMRVAFGAQESQQRGERS